MSLTAYKSFLFDDGNPVTGTVVNPRDNTGRDFLNNEIVGPDIGVYDYAKNARGREPLDFKARGINGVPENEQMQFLYRGMPFEGVTGFGNQDGSTTTYASARDVGNVAAGYVAGSSGMSCRDARLGFDGLESIQAGRFTSEGVPTQKAQMVGFGAGLRNYAQKHPILNLFRESGDNPPR